LQFECSGFNLGKDGLEIFEDYTYKLYKVSLRVYIHRNSGIPALQKRFKKPEKSQNCASKSLILNVVSKIINL